ncbi:hypothetical protein R1flu_017268 [Riccia fluitans]|uniref:Uncharacterized protein n=1 Tax=Riccia fluitans TaxID=41844 RepID=A0ABD1XDP9_9MARC
MRATAASCGKGRFTVISGPTGVGKSSALAKRLGGESSADDVHVSFPSLPTDFGNLKLRTTLRNVNVRAERDPFAEFSAAFVEEEEDDEEEEENRGSAGMTDAEGTAIIAFETGGVGAAVADEDDEDGEDLWEEKV